MDLNQILELIFNRQLTIRQASEKYNVSRDTLSKEFKNIYGEIKAEEILQDNKANSTKKDIDYTVLKEIYFELLSGKMTGEEARKKLGISDKETLRTVLLEYIKDSKNEEDINQYREYEEKIERDYSGINFRLVAIDMIRANYSQSQMAETMGLTPRTLSREFNKLKNDEDDSLYKLIKVYSEEKMHRHDFEEPTRKKHLLYLDYYEMKNPELLKEPKESKTEKKNREEDELVHKVEKMKQEGYTAKQIADELGTSISGIRRARINKEKRDFLSKVNKEDDKEDISHE